MNNFAVWEYCTAKHKEYTAQGLDSQGKPLPKSTVKLGSLSKKPIPDTVLGYPPYVYAWSHVFILRKADGINRYVVWKALATCQGARDEGDVWGHYTLTKYGGKPVTGPLSAEDAWLAATFMADACPSQEQYKAWRNADRLITRWLRNNDDRVTMTTEFKEIDR